MEEKFTLWFFAIVVSLGFISMIISHSAGTGFSDSKGGAIAIVGNGEVLPVGSTDTTKPVVTMASPSNLATFKDGTNVELICTGTDNVGLRRAELWLEGPDFSFKLIKYVGVSGKTFTQKFYYTLNKAGSYKWNCRFFDTSNNAAYGTPTLSTSPVFTATPKITCTDSDGGVNMAASGRAEFGEYFTSDNCADNDLLEEAYCYDSQNIAVTSIYCSTYNMLCRNNACIYDNGIVDTSNHCKDSDGGYNIFTFGQTTLSNNMHDADSCILVNSYTPDGTPAGYSVVASCSGDNCFVHEFWCDPVNLNSETSSTAKCVYGTKSCSNGACSRS